MTALQQRNPAKNFSSQSQLYGRSAIVAAQRLSPGSQPEVIKLIATRPDAYLPLRAHSTDMGADLALPYDFEMQPTFYSGLPRKLDFGLIVHPDSYDSISGITLHLRSSMANSGLMLANGVGLIDATYPGHLDKSTDSARGICALVHYFGDDPCDLDKGDRVAQIVVYNNHGRLIRPQFQIVQELCDEEFKQFLADRKAGRIGGFGSTGA
jgi:dUTPase